MIIDDVPFYRRETESISPLIGTWLTELHLAYGDGKLGKKAIKMIEETIWETPIKGKVAHCYLEIDGRTRSVSLEIRSYGKEPSEVSTVIFEDVIKCQFITLYYNNRLITNIWTGRSIDLAIENVMKIVKETNGITVLHIYCSGGKPLYGELKERR